MTHWNLSIYCHTGRSIFRHTGRSIYRYIGIFIYRSNGTPIYRHTGIPIYRCTGTPIYRLTGIYLSADNATFFSSSIHRTSRSFHSNYRISPIPISYLTPPPLSPTRIPPSPHLPFFPFPLLPLFPLFPYSLPTSSPPPSIPKPGCVFYPLGLSSYRHSLVPLHKGRERDCEQD